MYEQLCAWLMQFEAGTLDLAELTLGEQQLLTDLAQLQSSPQFAVLVGMTSHRWNDELPIRVQAHGRIATREWRLYTRDLDCVWRQLAGSPLQDFNRYEHPGYLQQS